MTQQINQNKNQFKHLTKKRQNVTDAFLYTLASSPENLILNTGSKLNLEFKYRRSIGNIADVSITTVNNTIKDEGEAILQRAAQSDIAFEPSFNPVGIISIATGGSTQALTNYTKFINLRFSEGPQIEINYQDSENPYQKIEEKVGEIYNDKEPYKQKSKIEYQDGTPANITPVYPGLRDADREKYSRLPLQRQLAIDGIIIALHSLTPDALDTIYNRRYYSGDGDSFMLELPRKLLTEATAVSCQSRGIIESVLAENLDIIEKQLGIDSLPQWFNNTNKSELDLPSIQIPYAQLKKFMEEDGNGWTHNIIISNSAIDLGYLKTPHSCLKELDWDENGNLK